MDPKISVYQEAASFEPGDDFLLREGLELLANYRAIGNETHRKAVRDLVALLATAECTIPN